MKKASDILKEAAAVIEERGKLRDKDDGERSMGRAVEAYMALRGEHMHGELDGWLFLCVLKLARATAGKPHLDDWTDLAGYAALGAEYVSSLTDTGIRERLDEVRNEWADRYKTMDELVRLSEELGLYDIPDRKESDTEREQMYRDGMKAYEMFPDGNPVLGDSSDDWIEWNGGECPVDPEQWVEVRVRADDGDGKAPAGEWWWGRENFLTSYDIIAYRVVKE